MSSALTSLNFARIRLPTVIRLTAKHPVLVLPLMCVKPRKLNVSACPGRRRPVHGGEPPELDQPRLLDLQFQPEFREPLAQLGEEPLRACTMLEAHDEVVRVAHDDHVAACLPPPPSLDPLVEDVVQVHVGEQR